MTLLAGARRRSGDIAVRAIDSAAHLVIDWANAATIVSASQITNAGSLREQDDIIYDRDGSGGYVLYFSAVFTGGSNTWRVVSTDGATWSNPQQCTVDGAPMAGQDPSIVQTFAYRVTPTLHRDSLGRMWMYLENNTTSQIDVYYSIDGVAWTLGLANVIPTVPSTWERTLTGSPVARYDGAQYIVGYEGIYNTTESHGFAIGATPTSLTKLASNPVITAASFGATSNSAFNDAMWYSADGRVCATGHAGYAGDVTMYRAHTTNTDPATWAVGDFTLIGMVDAVRNDLTAFTHHDLLVTAPADDLSLVAVPLVAP